MPTKTRVGACDRPGRPRAPAKGLGSGLGYGWGWGRVGFEPTSDFVMDHTDCAARMRVQRRVAFRSSQFFRTQRNPADLQIFGD